MKVCVARRGAPSRRYGIELAAVFLMSFLALFVGMPLDPNIFDEGIVLTAAMRVAIAGQIPHRDFYYNYGPAQFTIVGGLFKVFGESILVERLYDLVLRALLATVVYAIVSRYCSRLISVCASLLTVLWLYALYHETVGSAVIPVSLFNLATIALILPLFQREVTVRRLLLVGALTGGSTLFRYDTGIAFVGIAACLVALATFLRIKTNRLRTIGLTLAPCLLGFAAVVLPVVIFYFALVPYHAFVRDILVYPTKFYYRARNLPFPAITWARMDNLEVYLLMVAIGFSLWGAAGCYLRARRRSGQGFLSRSDEQTWCGFFAAFGLLALIMYCKGFVRISTSQLYLAIVASLPILAGLFQRRFMFSRPGRISIVVLACLSISSVLAGSFREMLHTHWADSSLPGTLVASIRRATPAVRNKWCDAVTPLTGYLCFLPDDDHIQTIEFITSHTTPDQRLFVGLPRHDRIFANDNLIYYATQRLPATKWSQFDPFLVNSDRIQAQIVSELEATAPPYVVMDSEYEDVHEPNDSSKSSGVTLLDDYIRSKYRFLQAFGEMSVWERRPRV